MHSLNIKSICIVLAFSFVMQAEQNNAVSVSYYKDFDRINVAGIDPVTKDSLMLPYVQVKKFRDSSLQVKFYISYKNIYTKNYKYENGILMSTDQYRLNDDGCRGFKEYNFYFEKDKMITYNFCDYAAFSDHKNIFFITTEMWSNNRKDHISRTVYTRASGLPDIFFDCRKDFDGAIFNKRATVREIRRRADGDSILSEGGDYRIKAGQRIDSSLLSKYHERDIRPVISVWRWLEDYNRRFPPF